MRTTIAALNYTQIKQHRTAVARVSMLLTLTLLYLPFARAEGLNTNPLAELPARAIAAAYGDERTYEVRRNGKSIGTHTIRFDTTGSELIVSVDASITVTILKVPVYRLKYIAKEIWVDDQMMSSTATTVENGDSTTVSWNSNDSDDDALQFSTNHWHPSVLTKDVVFNTLTGEESRITVTPLGSEEVPTDSGPINAMKYRYSDDISADVWYDTGGLWLKLAFTQDGDSKIEYIRRD